MKVHIQNYQSLKDVEFEVKGLTVITGQNNTGKSACARALCGVFSNTRGNSHVRVGEKHSTVKVTFDDNSVVEWKKGKGVNSYSVDGTLIDKVGSSVPDEVKDLGVVSVDVSGKEVWPQVSKQFEQVFLLDLPPSVLSSALSDVDKIQKLEKASGMARSDIKSLKSKIKFKREDLELEKEKVKGFEGLDEASKLILEVDQIEDDIQERQAEIESLEKVQRYRSQWVDEIRCLSQCSDVHVPEIDLKSFEKLDSLIALQKKRNEESIRVMIIGVGLDSFPNIPDDPSNEDYERYQKVLDRMGELRATISLLEPLEEIEIPTFTISEDTLSEAEGRRAVSFEVESMVEEIFNITKEIEDLKSNLTGTCPLCDSDLSTH